MRRVHQATGINRRDVLLDINLKYKALILIFFLANVAVSAYFGFLAGRNHVIKKYAFSKELSGNLGGNSGALAGGGLALMFDVGFLMPLLRLFMERRTIFQPTTEGLLANQDSQQLNFFELPRPSGTWQNIKYYTMRAIEMLFRLPIYNVATPVAFSFVPMVAAFYQMFDLKTPQVEKDKTCLHWTIATAFLYPYLAYEYYKRGLQKETEKTEVVAVGRDPVTDLCVRPFQA